MSCGYLPKEKEIVSALDEAYNLLEEMGLSSDHNTLSNGRKKLMSDYNIYK